MFQEGDEVVWMGISGKVKSVNRRYSDSVCVEFENGKTWTFREYGKWLDWHKEPSLHVTRRNKTYAHGGTYD